MLSTSVKFLWALLLLELYIHGGEAGTVKIGAFYDEDSEYGDAIASIIRDGINRVRNNRTLLPEPHSMTFVKGDTRPVNAVYTAIEDICDFINDQRPSALVVLDDKCPDCQDLAGILSHGSNPIFGVDVGSFEGGSKAFKMYPSPEDMTEFFIDVLHYFKWRAFTLLIDDGNALANFEGVMQEVKANDWNTTVIAIDPDNIDETLQITTTAKSKNILLYCINELVCKDVLDKGIEMNKLNPPQGSLNSQYTWILGNLDLSLPEQYKDSLEDTNAYITYFTMNFTREYQYTKPSSNVGYDSIYSFPMREKLAFDAVLAVGHALGEFVERKGRNGERGDAVLPGDTQMLTCPTAVDVAANNALSTELMGISFEGMTGNVAFDEIGNRVNYTITIFSGRGDTLRQLRGEWTQNPQYLEDRRQEEWQNEGRLNTTAFRLAKDRKIRIVSVEVAPFLFLREKLVQAGRDGGRYRYKNYRYKREEPTDVRPSGGQYTGNGRYEGYVMEFLERIRSVIRGIDFEYQVELVPDGKYGAPGVYSRIWNGMVGEIVRGKADVAVGPLTVTGSRQKAVDFSYPFMSSGIQSLILNPIYVKHDPFRIVYPFTIDAWFLNFICMCTVILMLYMFNRYDPYEWRCKANKKEVGDEHADNFNMKNSIWFAASTLFLQSYDNSPRSNASRCITGFWWLFVLITVFLYLTNVTFFITSNKRLAYVQNAGDVMAQKEIKFGTIRGGNTYHRLKSSSSLRKFWHKMNNDHADVYVEDMAEGVKRIRSSNGRYALLGETPELNYIASFKPCNLKVVGEYITRTQYALAVSKESPLKDHLSSAIEALRDNGVMEDLERDWWDLEDKRHRCTNLTRWERSGAYSINSNDVQGVYYMLMVGIGASVIVFLVELICFKCRGKGKTKTKRRNVKTIGEGFLEAEGIKGSGKGHEAASVGASSNQWI